MADSHDSFDNNKIDDDLMSMLNQLDNSDPVYDDLNEINELLKGLDKGSEEDTFGNSVTNSSTKDVGDVFSDALKAVSSLEDEESENINEILSEHPDVLNNESDKKSFLRKVLNIFKKKDKSSKLIKKRKIKKNKSDEIESNNADLTEPALMDEYADDSISDVNEADVDLKSREKQKKAKAKKQKKVKAEKKIKKIKKKKAKPEIIAIDDIVDEKWNVNLFSVAFVCIFLALLIIFIFIGVNVLNYSASLKKATEHFQVREYNEAFDAIYGVNVKDEDIEIYDKIITVMYVNKQLNSYNNYYGGNMYSQALDSLFKGLMRYDKYIELARLLGIQSDLDYVRGQIIAELEKVFGISEEEAIKIMRITDTNKYSDRVNEIVLKQNKTKQQLSREGT